MHMGANKLFFRLPRQHVQNKKEFLNTEETNTAVKRTAHESEFELPVNQLPVKDVRANCLCATLLRR